MEGLHLIVFFFVIEFFLSMFMESKHSNEVLCRFVLSLVLFVTASSQAEINHLSDFF